MDPYWCQDLKNLIMSLFGPFGGQFGPIFVSYSWGIPLATLLALVVLIGPVGPSGFTFFPPTVTPGVSFRDTVREAPR